jgi:hypothetical protein
MAMIQNSCKGGERETAGACRGAGGGMAGDNSLEYTAAG